MEDFERLIEMLNLNEIQNLNESIQKSNNSREVAQNNIFEMLKKKTDKDQTANETTSTSVVNSTQEKESNNTNNSNQSQEWTEDEIKLLVKGVKLIAVGTRDRWDVVAKFIEEHSRGKYKRTGKEVLTKTKEMQKLDPAVKEEANKKAFEKTFQNIKNDVLVQDKPTERYASPAEQLLAEQGTNPAPWTSEEQKILEQALKSYPASLQDRWDKIAECLPNRSKKDCIVRYKELVELIQSKKRAQIKSQK